MPNKVNIPGYIKELNETEIVTFRQSLLPVGTSTQADHLHSLLNEELDRRIKEMLQILDRVASKLELISAAQAAVNEQFDDYNAKLNTLVKLRKAGEPTTTEQEEA